MTNHEQLIRAVQRATRTLAKSGNFDALLRDVLRICVEAVEAFGGTIYLHDPVNRTLRFQHVLPDYVLETLPMRDIPDNYGMAGEAFQTRTTLTKTFTPDPKHERTKFEEATGVTLQSMISVPLMLEDEEPIGVVQMINKASGAFTDSDVSVMDTVAAVCTLAFINSRLTEEATRASTLLGMGKVSHDIGNLAASLYASLQIAEFCVADAKEDLPEPKRESLEDCLEQVNASVGRIVGYSRLISDLSAGRALRPTKKLGSLQETIEHATAYLEPEARKNGVRLTMTVTKDAPLTEHDELYVGRIVQNLVGNAIKAVVETVPAETLKALDPDEPEILGQVAICHECDGKAHFLRVSDTGPGMPPEMVNRILAGTVRSQWVNGSGSGWGTKIVMELAATHQATVDIQSEPGKGTTFVLTFPHVG